MIGIFTNLENKELISWVIRAGKRVGIPAKEFKVIQLDREGILAREHGKEIRAMDACIVDIDVRDPFYYAMEVGSLGEGVEYTLHRLSYDPKGRTNLDFRLLLVTKRKIDSHEVLRHIGESYSSVSLADGVTEELTEDLATWLKDTLDRSQPKIFISYRSRRRNDARSLAESLKRKGASIWFDEWSIMPGDSIPEAINRGLDWCTHLVLIVDSTFFESRWSKAEYESVLYRHLSDRHYFRRQPDYRPLIPLFMVDPASSKMPPMLARIRGIDCRKKNWEEVATQLWNAITTIGPR